MTDPSKTEKAKIETLEEPRQELTPEQAEAAQGGGGYADAAGGDGVGRSALTSRTPLGTE